MSTHTIDITAIEPLPQVVAMQRALEALESADVDLYPREVQPTNVVRNRIQFAAFVVRRHLKQQTQEKPAAPLAAPGPWHLGGTFLPGTPDVHCTVWGTAPAGHASGDEIAKYVHPRDAQLIVAAPNILAALQQINDWCCYATQENVAARLLTLQKIGQLARTTMARAAVGAA